MVTVLVRAVLMPKRELTKRKVPSQVRARENLIPAISGMKESVSTKHFSPCMWALQGITLQDFLPWQAECRCLAGGASYFAPCIVTPTISFPAILGIPVSMPFTTNSPNPKSMGILPPSYHQYWALLRYAGGSKTMIGITPVAWQPHHELWTPECLNYKHSILLGMFIDTSTATTYSSALNSYLTFCKMHALPVDPIPQTLSYYITFQSFFIDRLIPIWYQQSTRALFPRGL